MARPPRHISDMDRVLGNYEDDLGEDHLEEAGDEQAETSASRVAALLDALNAPGDEKADVIAAIIKSLLGNRLRFPYDRNRLERTPARVRILLDELAWLIEREPALSSAVQAHPLFNHIASGSPKVAPLLPPEEWGKRPRESRETCIDFAERVYEDWIKKGMTLSDLRDLDRPLYTALAKWLERYKGEDLPKRRLRFLTGGKAARTQRIKQELKELGIKQPADAYRVLPNDPKRANRLYQAALRLTRDR